MDVRLIWNELISKFEASYPFTDTKNPLVTETGTQTLTNKTLTTPTISAATLTGKVTSYNGDATVGNGVPSIVGYGRATAQAAANASVAAATVGAADGTFEVSMNVTIISGTTFGFSMALTYTNESNTSTTLILDSVSSALQYSALNSIANANGNISYAGRPVTIRAKAGTTITLSTSAGGTYTNVSYNVEGLIIRKV